VTAEEWDALVRRIEPVARENPKGYRRRVALLGAAGYGVIALALALLAALGVGVVLLALNSAGVLVKLLLPIGALAWVILRALWVRVEPPVGIRLERRDAPELFELVDEVRREIRGPKVHRVLVDGDLNAGIVQVPRLAVFLQRNYLVLGLPLLQALDPDEFRAVLAHELGHLAHSHGRFGAWTYRVRMTWVRLLEALEERRSWTTGLFRRFFEWYVPYFSAYSFPLMRAHEFEADRVAAEAAGPEAAGRALVRVRMADRVLHGEFWPGLFDRADREAEPPADTFEAVSRVLPAVSARKEAGDWLEQDLGLEADTADTHPSLADRLAALGVSPTGLLATNGAGETAARRYLGDREEQIAAELSRDWRNAVGASWRSRHSEVRIAEGRLRELDSHAADGELSDEHELERARLTTDLRPAEEALPLWRKLIERDPGNPEAQWAVGTSLLADGNESGLEHIGRAMDADPEAIVPGCDLAASFLAERGREQEAEAYRRRAEEQIELFQRAGAEREEISVDDELEPHDLPPEVVRTLRERIAAHADVARAFLVRKRLRHLADEYPLYVVAVVPKNRWRTLWREADDDRDELPLADRVAQSIELPHDFQVLVPGPRSGLDSRLERIEGAEIFAR
jgi:Zn-dependent protease with chaperone function